MAEIIQPREPEAVPANNEGNASQSQPREADQGLVATPINDKVSGQPTNRRATGPRTELGKTRSSRNAIKSGIFSRATLLEGESGSEYQSLLDGLWKALGPEGELEEILVQKLVSISWRYHRLLVAECAEIRKNSDFLEFDLRRVREQEAEEIAQVRPQPQTAGVADDCLNPAGLIWNFENPDVLARCLELLVRTQKGSYGRRVCQRRKQSADSKTLWPSSYSAPSRNSSRCIFALAGRSTHERAGESARRIFNTRTVQADSVARDSRRNQPPPRVPKDNRVDRNRTNEGGNSPAKGSRLSRIGSFGAI